MADKKKGPFSREWAEGQADKLKELNFEPIWLFPIAMIPFSIAVLVVDPTAFFAFLAALLVTSPFWLPRILARISWMMWIEHIRLNFWAKQERVLLKIQLPPEVARTPKTMEMFLAVLDNGGGESPWRAKGIDGKFRANFSLEIVSDGGSINFYLQTRKGLKEAVEARLYGAYPEAVVTVVPDYVSRVPFSNNTHAIFGFEFKKLSNFRSIKTYTDYGLDRAEDQEFRVDPLVNVLELLSTMGPDEHFWIQYIIRTHKQDEWFTFTESFGIKKRQDKIFKEAGEKEIAKIIKGANDRMLNMALEGADSEDKKKEIKTKHTISTLALSKTESEDIAAIQEYLGSSPVWELGVRVLYIAPKAKFRGGNAGALGQIFNPFKGGTGFVPNGAGHAGYSYAWHEWFFSKDVVNDRLFWDYKNRAWFHSPLELSYSIINAEELATLWHFPGTAVSTPGLNRNGTRTTGGPDNLPGLPN